MKKRDLEREGVIMVVAITVMVLKIMVAVMLLHRWKLQAQRDGRPFGDAEEE